MVEHLSCKEKVLSSILRGGKLFRVYRIYCKKSIELLSHIMNAYFYTRLLSHERLSSNSRYRPHMNDSSLPLRLQAVVQSQLASLYMEVSLMA